MYSVVDLALGGHCTAWQEMVLLDTVFSVVWNGHVEHCAQCNREWSCWTLTVYNAVGNGLVGHCVQCSREWPCWKLAV